MNTVSNYLAASALGILSAYSTVTTAQSPPDAAGAVSGAQPSAAPNQSTADTPSPQEPVTPTAQAQEAIYDVPLQALRTGSVKTATGDTFGDVEDVVIRNDGGHAGFLITSADGKSVLFIPVESLSFHNGDLIIQGESHAEEIGDDSDYDISRYQSASQGARTLEDAIEESRVSTR